MRFRVDYQKMNNVTKRDAYPLPQINDTLDRLGAAKYFVTLDLQAGYRQVHTAEEDQENTVFTTNYSLFQC